jgi:hypothetical protein
MLIPKFYQVQCSNGRLIEIDWNCSSSSLMWFLVCDCNEECSMEGKLDYYYFVQCCCLVQWNWNVDLKFHQMANYFFRSIASCN